MLSITHRGTGLAQSGMLTGGPFHQFRIVVNYLVWGVEKYTENVLEESLELLNTSYVVNENIAEEPPQSQNGFKVRSRIRVHHPDYPHDAGHVQEGPHQALPPVSGESEHPPGGAV